ncbi:MAG TPA: amidohydrolase family protein [Polyangia bacterium]|nr:amidohydrolase family protein [Polyangia bacterium]
MHDSDLDLVLRGGTVVTAEGQQPADVGVRDGRVAVIRDRGGGDPALPAGRREIDATGRLLLPGGIDPHVHLHTEGVDPGEPIWVDDYASGSEAALAGGVTSLGNMSFILPWESIADRVAAERSVVERTAIADVFFHTIVLSPTAALVEEVPSAVRGGQPSMKVFMCLPTFDANVPQFARVMKAAGDAGGITLVHCEDLATIECCTTMLTDAARGDLTHFAESRPVEAETVATDRALAMCRATRAPTYIVHLSSARALAACAAARAEGLPVFVETRPLYLHMTSERYHEPEGPLYVAQPPLREAADREALWRGLVDGSIDTIASDHAPWTRELKLDPKLNVAHCRSGVAELDTMLPLLYTEGVLTGRLTPERFVALTSTNAARLFGMYPRKGTIAVGSDADIAVWETRERRIIRDADLFSRAGHSVYAGRELRAWPYATLRRGELVFENGKMLGRPGSGRAIERGATAPPVA